ncbi:hypothetical protein Poli38472_012401 [Pythium oligandrum]|uniref:Uracil-DNA glycosylase n=1 Tax=Pythium oligandrum TaxID=41045 RepID=A0A8K1CPT6_PYTOL|nr:hypothetical protein Poli38472_012401 [Pythium oligandrum]|eukprot:TMW67285.1 hypothetical protein Poli38472_012401 [Pythium oligandrum]
MGQTRDIRSFFGGAAAPPSKRRRTDATPSSDADANAASDKENGSKAGNNDEEDVTKESADGKTQESKPSADDSKAPAAKEGDDDDKETEKIVEHKFKNLHENVQVLMHATWYEQLEREFKHPQFKSLVKFLEGEESRKRTIYPAPENVFAALRDCAFSSLKVVILGQDPYHGPSQAHGLSFSVLQGVPPPPSLANIFKEAIADVQIKRPGHGCLSCWSKQGVLMLNTVLTVRRGEPNSHKNQGWERITDAIIDRINKNSTNVVFLLWGKPAQTKGALINQSKHLVIKSSHPSPLGATKTKEPFIGSKCFSKANEYLVKHGKDPIDWNVV